ncbi:Hypothetical_protein [Hexamita inflata]|uniref:Hypothetical_protein n=1 Tax=Hexamita inflata TaxID=28002 RepID=A0AA86Q9E1_9EUKA|nr:Hypothetical protein HINF_LOCUS42425 [Hexamita inflata]
MGRPFMIKFDAFSRALSQSLHLMSGVLVHSNKEMYKVFKAQPRVTRVQLWEQIGQVLGKSAVQVKNYFFNTWVERLQAEQREDDQISYDGDFTFTSLFSLFDENLL